MYKINEISLRHLKTQNAELCNSVNDAYQNLPELRELMVKIANVVDTENETQMRSYLASIADQYKTSLIHNAFKNALIYLEKTQSDEVLTKINEILNSKIGDTVFNLLDNYYITKPKNKEELKQIIDVVIKQEGYNCDLNCIDTSLITDMSELFMDSSFNGDISKWDVSNVKNMTNMFNNSKFNGDISKWDVSNVKNMSGMFYASAFNGDISEWDVSNVKNMSGMFGECHLKNYDISRWDVSNVKDMNNMFVGSIFNGDISEWDVSNVKDMWGMFAFSTFNQDISKWNVSNVKDIEDMFANSPLEDKPEYQPKFNQ